MDINWIECDLSSQEANSLVEKGNLFLVKYIKDNNPELNYDVLKFKKVSKGHVGLLGNYFLSDFNDWVKIVAYCEITE